MRFSVFPISVTVSIIVPSYLIMTGSTNDALVQTVPNLPPSNAARKVQETAIWLESREGSKSQI